MRILLFLFVLLPAALPAQINRSARELAQENVREYLAKKLFTNQPYKSISFSELKSRPDNNKTGIAWTIDHQFEITEKKTDFVKNSKETQKTYSFIFYLDDKMKVVKAESYSRGQ
jgi:hypothetical protein